MAVHSVLDLSTLVLVSCAQGIPEQCARFLSESLTFVGPFGITTVAGAHAFMEYFAKMAPLFTKLDLTFGCPTIVFQSNEKLCSVHRQLLRRTAPRRILTRHARLVYRRARKASARPPAHLNSSRREAARCACPHCDVP